MQNLREKEVLVAPMSHIRECNYPGTLHMESQFQGWGFFLLLTYAPKWKST